MRHKMAFLLIAVAFVGLFSERYAAPQQAPANDSKSTFDKTECIWLLSNLSSGKGISVGQRSLFIGSQTAQKLDDLRSQLTHLGTSGVVVYAPVIADGKITMMRLESRADGESPVLQAHKTEWNEHIFRTAIRAAQQPGGDFFRRDLHRELVAEYSQADVGKSTFLFDPESYGLAPQALGLRDSVLLGSSDFKRALANLQSLKESRFVTNEFAAVLGLPGTEEDFNLVFRGSKKFGELAEWQKYSNEALEVASEHGIRVISGSRQMAAKTKGDLMHDIEKQTGIIFIVAHAEGARIFLPGNNVPIEITPSDIGNLHLRKNPFVLLRVCQGDDHGFANAFLKAGAVGVWSNRGVIRADVAIEQVRLFLDHLRAGGNTLDAIAHVMSRNTSAAANSTLFTMLEHKRGDLVP